MAAVKENDVRRFNVDFTGIQVMSGGYRNFAGVATKFNAEGHRNFNILLSAKQAEEMLADGWNVKTLQPRDESEDVKYFVKINVGWNTSQRDGRRFGPTVKLHTPDNPDGVELDEDNIGLLDTTWLKGCDITVQAHDYAPGKLTAWLQVGDFYVDETHMVPTRTYED